jgi:hypothetical protein
MSPERSAAAEGFPDGPLFGEDAIFPATDVQATDSGRLPGGVGWDARGQSRGEVSAFAELVLDLEAHAWLAVSEVTDVLFES